MYFLLIKKNKFIAMLYANALHVLGVDLGSFFNYSHLYRSSSFNSSGRSSNCDTTEDVYSDLSLEDVQDLNHKVMNLSLYFIFLSCSLHYCCEPNWACLCEHAENEIYLFV